MNDWWSTLVVHLRYEFVLKIKQTQSLIQALLFFIMMLLFFPMSLPASAQILHQVGSGLIWIALLFVSLLASEGLFQRPFEDGRLEQWLVSGESLPALFLAIIIMHSCVLMLPIVLLCPWIMILYGADGSFCWVTMLSLVTGAPGLIGLTVLAAAFNVGRMPRTTFMALILLPLTLPIMIFGSSAPSVFAVQGTAMPVYALLLAMSLMSLTGLPFAIAGVLRLRFED
jgi:heme exporter protein B